MAIQSLRSRASLILDAAHVREMLFDDIQDSAQRKDLSAELLAVRDILPQDLDMRRKVQLQYYARQCGKNRENAPGLRF
jgi:hypothetical protein